MQADPQELKDKTDRSREREALKLSFSALMEKSKSVPESSCSYAEFNGFGERSNSYSFNGPSHKGNGFYTSNDAEFKRKKRIKAYNGFTVEGKLKSSVRNSFKWIKNKFTDTATNY
ncbi:uncharacterized protein LOC114729587 [Neltuma alba]|uniref:uncharacterized protein LOC114722120 n=1 Tax=Neltuma alba TaxID=207710 RepID=UPI0010A3B5D8|nr:uncharacterized protein LOC114722120 [Prosopis alba]XP_028767990.1 uncharacterized protein LOC114725627 [Prosopis alba]XP_028772449.1 uncharacterized protein LOC114729587 [Prosopis alba]